MRSTELIAKIYDRLPKMAHEKYDIDQLFDRCMDIQDMIEMERPEICRRGQGHPRTEEEWLEEMRKYPHRDNHMD